MKRHAQISHVISCMLLLFTSMHAVEKKVLTKFMPRSQGVNSARRLAGQHVFMNQCSTECPYGFISVLSEYTQSFRPDDITKCLFGDSCRRSTITISGSQSANRGADDWLADYFYLPTDFKSELSFTPRISNFIVDINYYLGLDEWCEGLYVALYAPMVQTRWDLNMQEKIINKGVNQHPAGYFSPQPLSRGQLMADFTQYASGFALQPVQQTINPDDDMSEKVAVFLDPLTFGQISCKKRTKARLAELRGVLGYNILPGDDCHVGVAFHLCAPTGNRLWSRFLFEPVVGNGHHFELGGSINAHYMFWADESETVCCGVYFDAVITHFFNTRQLRTIDLRGRPFSRYMLAQSLNTPVGENLRGATSINMGTRQPTSPTEPSTSQFNNTFTPISTLSTITADVSIAAQADVTLLFHLRCRDLMFDFGYNFWGRSCEKMSVRRNRLEENTRWALKGDARVYGFASATDGGVPSLVTLNDAVPLAASQSDATIHAGTNVNDSLAVNGTTNTGIDNPQFAFAGTNDVNLNTTPPSQVPLVNFINTSIQPKFLSPSDLDVCDVLRSSGMSSKFFGNFSYTWESCSGWQPYVGLGFETEFAHGPSFVNECDDCIKCALSQWGIWVRLGVAYN